MEMKAGILGIGDPQVQAEKEKNNPEKSPQTKTNRPEAVRQSILEAMIPTSEGSTDLKIDDNQENDEERKDLGEKNLDNNEDLDNKEEERKLKEIANIFEKNAKTAVQKTKEALEGLNFLPQLAELYNSVDSKAKTAIVLIFLTVLTTACGPIDAAFNQSVSEKINQNNITASEYAFNDGVLQKDGEFYVTQDKLDHLYDNQNTNTNANQTENITEFPKAESIDLENRYRKEVIVKAGDMISSIYEKLRIESGFSINGKDLIEVQRNGQTIEKNSYENFLSNNIANKDFILQAKDTVIVTFSK